MAKHCIRKTASSLCSDFPNSFHDGGGGRVGSLRPQVYSPHVHYTRAPTEGTGKAEYSQGPSSKPCTTCGVAFAWKRGLSLSQAVDSPRPTSPCAPRYEGRTHPDNSEALPGALWGLHLAQESHEKGRNGKMPGHTSSHSPAV